MKKLLVTGAVLTALVGTAVAGGSFGTIRSNFNWDIDKDDVQFEYKRAYIGYKTKFESGAEAKITLDVKPEAASKSFMYLKYAYVSIPLTETLKMTTGLQVTSSFLDSYKFFGKAYYGWNPISIQSSPAFVVSPDITNQVKVGDGSGSSDNGVSVNLKVNDQINVKASVVSGNGYTKLGKGAQDPLFALYAGYKAGMIQASIYQSINPFLENDKFEDGTDKKMQSMTSAFVGWKHDMLRLGATGYTTVNKGGSDANGAQVWGAEFIAAAFVVEKVEAFINFQNWATYADKSGVWAADIGLEYAFEKNLLMALIYRTADDEINDTEQKQSLGVYTKVGF
ncbi:MAG: hypothetical protein OCD01_03600 [Fibrobacterales bacterium]